MKQGIFNIFKEIEDAIQGSSQKACFLEYALFLEVNIEIFFGGRAGGRGVFS